ncbi:MAG: family N-acetyltransferase [Ilumatobacteraceae bacterium]|nr:family N-acetyltransferase [Ilumatobacteraceae bacterium]MCU1391331.1 family N-acetyltransferase [Ilumatobacteraceae bacterium]
MSITLRAVAPTEVDDAIPKMDAVMRRAYKAPSFRAQIGWYAAVQPDGLVVAEDAGEIVGTGCGIAYPDGGFGWIGLIGTEPTHERRGIGALLTERVAEVLAGHGCDAALDASAAGGPLYERIGFTDHGPTRVVAVPRRGTPHPRVLPVGPDDLAAFSAYDAGVFGADRSALLALLVAQYPGRSGLVRGTDGAVVGIVLAQHVTVGPLAADDADTLAELVAFAGALPWNDDARICVPPESGHLDALLALGCVPGRDLRHMRRGVPLLPGRTAAYAGRISLGIG